MTRLDWTARFGISCGLAALWVAVQAGWFGLAPQASLDLATQVALLSLVGMFAIRGSALGMAIGLFVAIFVIYTDQATLALGLPALPFGTPDDFWISTVLRAAVTWALFPLFARLLARLLPEVLGGIACGLGLLPLPFVRYGDAALVVTSLMNPGIGRFVVLPVPWLPLAALVALVVSALLALGRFRPWPRARRVAVAALVVVTVIVPGALALGAEQRMRASVDVSPASGPPLTNIVVRARTDATLPGILLWDGDRARAGGTAVSLFVRNGTASAVLVPAGQSDFAPGRHTLSVRFGDEVRTATFVVVPASGLSLSLEDRHLVVRGPANADLTVLTIGPQGSERLDVSSDDLGEWRSPLGLGNGPFTVIVQAGSAWSWRDVE